MYLLDEICVQKFTDRQLQHLL